MVSRATEKESPTPRIKQGRQAHKKTRSGCANCRFRRVKCDETKPACRKCKKYMVLCSYTDTGIKLSCSSNEFTGYMEFRPHTSSRHLGAIVLNPRYIEPSMEWEHEVIHRFRYRTALTMGSPSTIPIYANAVPQLAMQHKYLFHVVVATTLLHDRALAGSAESLSSECYHLSQAAAKFNRKLSSTIKDEDRDPLWVTAVYMCTTAVFNINTTNPHDAWPLTSSSSDLEWLNLQAGLRIMWSLADLDRPDGAFACVPPCPDEDCVFPKIPEPGIVGLPSLLVELCELNEASDGSNNHYHTAVRFLSWLLPFECTPANILKFMVFAGGMTKSYRSLLHRKDPRALLLLAIWYSRMFKSIWWMVPRATVECQAICLYLTQFKTRSSAFQRVLSLVIRSCENHVGQLANSTVLSMKPAIQS